MINIGKMPPQATDIEEAVLGAILLENTALPKVEFILPDFFYKEAHAIIFQAIITLYKKSYPVDILTVTQELKKAGKLDVIGGAYYITQLTNRVASASNIEFHALIIRQKYLLRKAITIASDIIKEAYDEGSDCFDVIDSAEKQITQLTQSFSSGKLNKMSSLWNVVSEKNYTLLNQKGLIGVPSGYIAIDKLTGGFQAPDLIILAARPSMGKTSLAMNFARNAAVDFGKPGILFSLEMGAAQIASRAFALESNTSISQLTRRGVPVEEMLVIEQKCTRLINSQIYIDDTASISLMELRSKSREYKREKGIEWIMIDYLQLMTGDKSFRGNREQEISGISRGLKALAKELNIPIIALSQLSRANEQRGGNKRPQLSDLRESGALEQDADIVMFIHRPEYYGMETYDNGESTKGIAEIIFAKHRNGATGTEKLKFINYLTKFVSIKDETEKLDEGGKVFI
jgi:replicative DNA helicase